MTTFTWSIVTLERNEADGGVVRAHFKIEALETRISALEG
jgi:hypothetical protein